MFIWARDAGAGEGIKEQGQKDKHQPMITF